MGDPLTMAISAGTSLIGSAVSAAGSEATGKAQAENLQYQAQVAANNAEISKRNADLDIQAGEVAASNTGLKTRAAVGAEKAAQGGNGIDSNTGSAVAVRAGTESMGLLDAMTVRSNAAKQAYSQQVQATNETEQAQLDKQGAAQAKQAGDIGAASSLLGGVSSVASKYAGWMTQNPG